MSDAKFKMSNARFKVIKIDPEGSGEDYSGHLGMIVTDAARCCKNCTVIFGTMAGHIDAGPFITGELRPLNKAARQVLKEIQTDYPWTKPLTWWDSVKKFFGRKYV